MLIDRRQFTAAASGGAVAGFALPVLARSAPGVQEKRIRFAVKWNMVKVAGGPRERFAVCKEAGLDGIELVSPTPRPIDALVAARDAVGLPIHGVVDGRHWKLRLSDPDESVRARGREILAQALRDSERLGGHSVLLVPGVVGDDATHDEVWSRSMAEVKRVLPTAAALGVRVLIENVWNGFCETPELLRDYVDAFDSPWVGVYFDLGNAQKFAPTEQWIRVLGSRIVKLDVKGWGADGGFGKIGDGDVNWPAVREALDKVGFTGWATGEVKGGDAERIAEIARRMRRVLAPN